MLKTLKTTMFLSPTIRERFYLSSIQLVNADSLSNIKGLQELYSKYQSSGLELLDFPSNQFLEAPGSSEELASFCQVNFGTTFKTFAKIDVNGKNASPLFTFLKENVAEEKDNEEMSKFKKVLSDLKQTFVGDDIKWNFTKFLVDREGNVVARFAPTVTPDEIDGYVAKLL